MVSTPGATPVAIPLLNPIVAMPVWLLVQVPPPPSVRVSFAPLHTWLYPLTGPGDELTVKVLVAAHPPPPA